VGFEVNSAVVLSSAGESPIDDWKTVAACFFSSNRQSAICNRQFSS